MGGEVVLEIAARLMKRHVVFLEQCVYLKARLQLKESSDLTLRQCPSDGVRR